MLKKLWPYARTYRKWIILGVVCSAAEAVFELLIPLVMSDIVDIGIENRDTVFIMQKGVLMIAMAMVCNPKLMIADEPTTALDVTIQAQILDLLKELRQKYHLSVILITHDNGIAATAERVVRLSDGRIIYDGSREGAFT